ncbi:T9SS type A sorting domain-containing protein [Weeksellaceae bacterium KMM 9713]|uniref:T9SS type A sorting domain-containing protein n=1 Tax=Profundicola chukchiensis TaxID=2961959 RepID=A0A9X4RUI7_9FLAO|nr:T9SS type A sorting domain-containing protein [Profundicola chukchiensis]MDG4944805.1 T9SS type A sorting domain-containing protein [Profundicola chukchiensis]
MKKNLFYLIMMLFSTTSLFATTSTATCADPTGFDVVRTSDTTAVISVDNPNDIYDVFIAVNGAAGANPNSGPTPGPNDNVTGFPQTRTGLNANSVYDVWIRKECNGDNSDWVGPVHVPVYQAPAPTCDNPTGFDVVRTSDTTAVISVDNPNDIYDVFIAVDGSAGANPNSGPTPGPNDNVTGFPQTRTGLNANSVYDIWIRKECNGNNSDWVGPVHVPVYQAPAPTCDNPTGFDVVRTSDTTAVISVDNPNDIYDVFIAVDGSAGANPNSGPTPGPNDNVTGFPQTRTGLNANSVYDVWIRKECNGNNSDWVGPVHVPVYQAPAPTCDNPTGFDVVRTSDTTAVISVDNPNDIYDVFIAVDGSAGANPNSGPTPGPNDNVTGFPQTRTGLNANSVYDVWIRKECNGDNSDWVGPVHVPLFVDPNVCAIPNPTINRTSPTDIEISTDVAVYDMLLNTQPSKPGVAPHNPQSQYTNLSGTLTRNNLNPGMTYYVWFRQKCSTTDISDWSQMYTISPVAQQPMKLYPNPAVSNVKIEGSSVVSVQVLNMNGKVELSKKVNNNEINLDGLAPGQYIIQATDAQGNVSTSKLMKK